MWRSEDMKKVVFVFLGSLLSFGLTILSARILFDVFNHDSTLRIAVTYGSSPLIAIAVGVFVGLTFAQRARTAACLSLAPWTLWLVLTTDWNRASSSQIAVTLLKATVYLLFGIAAAAFVSRRMFTSRTQ